MKEKILAWWQYIQEFGNIDGDIWVGLFALVFLARLLAPIYGHPQLNASEAGIWAATISALAYTKGPRPPGQA